MNLINNIKKLFPDSNFYICFFTDRKKINIIKIISNLPKKTIVIFREYDLPFRKRLKLAQKIQEICQKRDLKLIIGKDVNLAKEIFAFGIHFSDNDNFLTNYNKIKDSFFTTCSFHSKNSVLKYQNLNLNLRFLSPIFATTSHKEQEPLNIDDLKELTERKNIKICPLGGINIANINKLQNLNISGIAGIDLFNEILKN